MGPHYFQVVGVPLIAGRDFDEHDKTGGAAVAIINNTMARFYFGRSNPVGKTIRNGNDRYTIVGVARDMKERDLKGKTERRAYVPLFQEVDPIRDIYFKIRTRDNAEQMIPAISREIRLFDRNLKVPSLKPVRVLMDESISEDRLIAQLSSFFGLLALFLATNGLYGVISYTTARRSSEIGLRMALGADRRDVIRMALGAGKRDVLRMVIGQGLRLALGGIASGVMAALVLTRVLLSFSHLLYGVRAGDSMTLTAVSLLLIGVVLLACYIPARRATKIDPMVALRYE